MLTAELCEKLVLKFLEPLVPLSWDSKCGRLISCRVHLDMMLQPVVVEIICGQNIKGRGQRAMWGKPTVTLSRKCGETTGTYGSSMLAQTPSRTGCRISCPPRGAVAF